MARLTSGSTTSKPAATPSAETTTPREDEPVDTCVMPVRKKRRAIQPPTTSKSDAGRYLVTNEPDNPGTSERDQIIRTSPDE